jgi:undecaprenyl-diphosphatase
MDTEFRKTHVVAITLILGAVLFYFAERVSQRGIFGEPSERLDTPLSVEGYSVSSSDVSLKKGFIVGLFQCLALVPGMSRSGSTISGGLFAGLTRETAARFSFLLSIPIIFGSGLKKLLDLYQADLLSQVESSLLLASLFAFVSGLLAIHFLIKFLKNHSLNYFGIYRVILAIVILIWL